MNFSRAIVFLCVLVSVALAEYEAYEELSMAKRYMPIIRSNLVPEDDYVLMRTR